MKEILLFMCFIALMVIADEMSDLNGTLEEAVNHISIQQGTDK